MDAAVKALGIAILLLVPIAVLVHAATYARYVESRAHGHRSFGRWEGVRSLRTAAANQRWRAAGVGALGTVSIVCGVALLVVAALDASSERGRVVLGPNSRSPSTETSSVAPTTVTVTPTTAAPVTPTTAAPVAPTDELPPPIVVVTTPPGFVTAEGAER